MMTAFNVNLRKIGKMAIQQNLAYNLLLWMIYLDSYSVEDPHSNNITAIGQGHVQYFQMTGTPSQVFDLNNYAAGFAGAAG